MRMRRLLPFFATLLFFLLLDAVPIGFAQDGPALRSEADYAFGQVLRFHLELPESADLQQATLFFREQTALETFRADVSFAVGANELVYEVDLTQLHLAPYSLVTYWWVLQTEQGEVLSPQQTLAYEDDQYNWQRMDRDGVTAHWTGGSPAFGQTVLDVVSEIMPRLTAVLPLQTLEPFDIYVYPSSADLRAALRLTGLGESEGPQPELGVILVTAVNPQTAQEELRQSLPQAITQLLLYRISGQNYDDFPLWLREGLASTVTITPHPRYDDILETAVREGTTLPFLELCDAFPQENNSHLLAQAQSDDLIRFIKNRHGDQSLSALVNVYRTQADCAAGVRSALQISLADLETAWLSDRQIRTPSEQFWLDNRLWALILLGSFIITGLMIWRTKQMSTTELQRNE